MSGESELSSDRSTVMLGLPELLTSQRGKLSEIYHRETALFVEFLLLCEERYFYSDQLHGYVLILLTIALTSDVTNDSGIFGYYVNH